MLLLILSVMTTFVPKQRCAGPTPRGRQVAVRRAHPAAGFSQLLYHFARPPDHAIGTSSSSFERAAGALANGPRQARIVGCCCLPTTSRRHM